MMLWQDQEKSSIFAQLQAAKHRPGLAISFLPSIAADASVESLTWPQLVGQVTQAANLFAQLAERRDGVIAVILPTGVASVISLLGGMVAGIVLPINPTLSVRKIASLLREAGARVAVVPQLSGSAGEKLAQALQEGGITHALEVEGGVADPVHAPLVIYAPLFGSLARHSSTVLNFNDPSLDRVAAYFHTGGTTGMPKLAQHRVSGMLYNGWVGKEYILTPQAVVLAPLPLFHVFGVYTVLISVVMGGGHIIFPTADGYRGEGVIAGIWQLIARHQVSDLMIVPTVVAVLPPVDAPITSLRRVISGSAALTVAQHKRFEAMTGLQITEGYGLTECTCIVSINPADGVKKPGSVGPAVPGTQVRIIESPHNGVARDVAPGSMGEVCIANPGAYPYGVYKQRAANGAVFVDGIYLRSGDLGWLDEDGYLWLTGRIKDLIIRGGHNIDPVVIEEALRLHPQVQDAAAIGQPDAHAGELPAGYVVLKPGAKVSTEELRAHCESVISERAAVPKYIEILPDLPKTTVGKIYKVALRDMAIQRVYSKALREAGLSQVSCRRVRRSNSLGLIAQLSSDDPRPDDQAINAVLAAFLIPWNWDGEA